VVAAVVMQVGSGGEDGRGRCGDANDDDAQDEKEGGGE